MIGLMLIYLCIFEFMLVTKRLMLLNEPSSSSILMWHLKFAENFNNFCLNLNFE